MVTKLFAQERARGRLKQRDARTSAAYQSCCGTLKQHGLHALLLLDCSVLVFTATHKAVTRSHNHCRVHPECVAHAHRWSASLTCPCIAFVDVDLVPKTYEVWMNPPDATEALRTLTSSGDLRMLMIINRQFIAWPEELRLCTNLEHISLYYTGVQSVPDWAKHFQALEFLTIEGKFGDTNLLSLPDDLFASMSSLTFMHLGNHPQLLKLPAFNGLANLKSLSLALLTAVQELPSFDHLRRLARLEVVGSGLTSFPDMSHLSELIQFAVVGSGQMCCNGFLGACDLTSPLCIANPTTNATCLQDSDARATAETKRLSQRFERSVCVYFSLAQIDAITKASVDVCAGVTYRQCPQGAFASPGICVSEHMAVLMCHHDISVSVRRKQIQRGIGVPCDPVEEAWLGCL